ncbi:hypothetical protein PHMEG_0001481 [Phytophthora megakarya]|uniref:Peptidase A2 domain-containing protein n=1 Tax=Phytophthora megakarya TaxID=4795 RepID=A0A225X341_9STRA|nr:hypothetical protein PHMEG_0001481 [Phytophthora megakarya]
MNNEGGRSVETYSQHAPRHRTTSDPLLRPLGRLVGQGSYRGVGPTDTGAEWSVEQEFDAEMKLPHIYLWVTCSICRITQQEREIDAMAQSLHLRDERNAHVTTRRTWTLLSDAFIKYYCSKFNQSAKARSYSATRGEKEHVCDYLNRLNGYARNAGVQFENGGREAKDHMEQFLDTCDDRGLEEYLWHVRVRDIHDLETMINDILQRRERKSSREPTALKSHSRENTHRSDHDQTEDTRTSYRRDRSRDDIRRRDESPYRPRITLADAMSAFVAALNVNGSPRHYKGQSEASQYEEEDAEPLYDEEHQTNEGQCPEEYPDDGYASDGDYGHIAAANDTERRLAAEGSFGRSDQRQTKGSGGYFNSDKNHGRDGRKQFGPCAACGGMYHSVHYYLKRCKLCKQVHDAGKCEALAELTTLLRSKVDKRDLTPDLQSLVFGPPTETGLIPIGLPQLTEPAVGADYMFAFAGEVEWHDDRDIKQVNKKITEEEEDSSRYEREERTTNDDDRDNCHTAGVVCSLAQAEPEWLNLAARLLPCERLGRWSAQRYDKRKRMRALVMGAVNDTRTRIRLDTGANVSLVSASYSKKQRLRAVPDHVRSLEVRGINPGTLETHRRALVKITLGWEESTSLRCGSWITVHESMSYSVLIL